MVTRRTARPINRLMRGGRQVRASMSRSVFVADLGGTKLSAAIVDAQGRIEARQNEPVDASSTYAPVEQICRLASLLAGTRARRNKTLKPARTRLSYRAAGVAVPGLVRRSGTVWAPNLPGWGKVPLAQLLERRLGVPVVVESDRNAAVTGEVWRGAGRGKSDVIALTVGTGIGAGIQSGGALLRGAHELSGCVGWMVVSEEDNSDYRRLGSLEAIAAGPGIARAAVRAIESGVSSALADLTPQSITARDVAAAAWAGDRLALDVFERAGVALGLAVANLISLFDPQVVVLGGGMAGAADLLMPSLERTALARCQPLAARKARICVSRLGENVNLFGMARLAFALDVKGVGRPGRVRPH